MKKCPKCNKNKQLSNFGNDKSTKSGLTVHCKSCKKIASKKYRIENKAKVSETTRIYMLKRRNSDINFKLKANLRNRLYFAMIGNNKSKKTLEALGCSIEALKKYIESKFQKGMSWANYGKWHLDHIRPLSSAVSAFEIENLFHYTNLQPLWAKENLIKSDSWNPHANLS